MAQTPKPHCGLRHVALFSQNLDASAHFYSDILGFKVVWQPDADNIYLSSGTDNLALHRAPANFNANSDQRLDHLGVFLDDRAQVDIWHDYLKEKGVEIKAAPKDHRDGTRSLYCADPDGNVVQIIYYPLDQA